MAAAVRLEFAIMPAPLPVRFVHHISRVTRDVAASRAFYRDVLGFREIERPNFSFAGAWLFNYGVQIHLIHSAAAPPPESHINTRANHVALHVEDIEDAERRLVELGIPFERTVVPERNIRQLFFHDPDGHMIELGSYPATPPFLPEPTLP